MAQNINSTKYVNPTTDNIYVSPYGFSFNKNPSTNNCCLKNGTCYTFKEKEACNSNNNTVVTTQGKQKYVSPYGFKF